jgi:hypothetical protein
MIDVIVIKKYPLLVGKYKSSKKCRIAYKERADEDLGEEENLNNDEYKHLSFKILVKDALIYY